MNLQVLLLLLFSVFVLLASGAENATKPTRKTLRTVKSLKKSPKKKSSKVTEPEKSESYRIPIVISAPEDASHEIPVKLELHDDDRYIKSSRDVHPIEPIHVVRVSDDQYQHAQPVYVEAREPVYSAYSQENSPSQAAYHGPVAVPADYPYGNGVDNYYGNGIAPAEYYPEDYGDLSAIPGSPGVDYPTYAFLPKTGFECMEHTSTPGFYADVETKCQMWHYCQPDGRHDKFLCPNGTVFDQLTRVCNWWFNVHCDSSLSMYDINFDLYREPHKVLLQSLDYNHQNAASQKNYDNHQVLVPSHQNTDYHNQDSLSGSYHELPKVPLKALDYQHHQISPSSVETPNSFLRHLQDFESGVVHNPHSSDYALPIQAAASPTAVHRYPAKTAPVAKVHHEYDDKGVIDFDSSNPHTQTTPSEEHVSEEPQTKRRKSKKRLNRRKHRKHPKVYSKHADDDIPTYREGKATPSGRRLRVVRRRKVPKS